MTFYIKQNDTSPSIQATLENGDGQKVNLSGCSIRFYMKEIGSATVKVDGAVTVVNENTGLIRYDWVDSDTNVAGNYHGEFQVTYPSTKVETFPNDGYIKIKITDDIK